MSWTAKLVAAFVAAYALSPIDLIPDFIPVLGYVDDLLLLPLGLGIAKLLIPRPVLEEYRLQASRRLLEPRPRSRSRPSSETWREILEPPGAP